MTLWSGRGSRELPKGKAMPNTVVVRLREKREPKLSRLERSSLWKKIASRDEMSKTMDFSRQEYCSGQPFPSPAKWGKVRIFSKGELYEKVLLIFYSSNEKGIC